MTNATLVTNKGPIELELFDTDAPQTVANFLKLATVLRSVGIEELELDRPLIPVTSVAFVTADQVDEPFTANA